MNLRILLFFLLVLYQNTSLFGQVFGQNKPVYDKFDFEVLGTPNFKIYHYLQNEGVLEEIANWSEHWYRLHQTVLRDTIKEQNPLVLYNDHPDFQQTNTIQGSISTGTGGVTEAFKNRVIQPFAMSNQQTHHVLGHELVHAFQYNLILKNDSMSLQNLANVPLWMVEGLAEYMSIGRIDPHTAMWMRDAVLQDDLPRIRDLNNPKYFPYRYGHAFWAFVSGLMGDGVIRDYFVNTAKFGLEQSTLATFGIGTEELSKLWHKTLKEYYQPLMGDQRERPIGKKIIEANATSRMNIVPVISPNGKYIAFLSERNLFSIDLFLADARTGEIIRTLASATKSTHIDDYSYIESAGTWSPKSNELAIVGVKKGSNWLIIIDVETGKTIEEFRLEGVPAFSNPSWSPNGRTIVVSGLVDGQVDLFTVNLNTKQVTRLTNDIYSEVTPSWAPDGAAILFSTDELSFERGRVNGKWKFNLAELDIVNGTKEHLAIFLEANNLNPLYDFQGNILFLSDRDGFRNLYRYDIARDMVFQMTDLLTGISGLTPYAPAISLSRSSNRDKVLYTHYWKGGYNIYIAEQEQLLRQPVAMNDVSIDAAILPRVVEGARVVVDSNMDKLDQLPRLDLFDMKKLSYRPKFQMDYIGGSTGVGIGSFGGFGTMTGAAGGVDFLFSDVLGNNQLLSTLALNGEITDFAGVFSYLNRKNRIAWGAALSHVPFRSARFYPARLDNISFRDGTTATVIREDIDIQRIFEDRLNLFAQFPFSRKVRLEAGASFSLYYDRLDRTSTFYQAIPAGNSFFRGATIGQNRTRIEQENQLNLNFFTANAAVVGDNTYFGLTSPLQGWRYRFGAVHYMGGFNLTSVTADYRHYFRLKPVTLAFQAMHEGRYGADANNIFPIYLGYPWNIRGLGTANAEQLLLANNIDPNILLGSKGLVTKFEVRIPFTGPKQISLFKSDLFFSELSFFTDAGITWNNANSFNRDNVYFNFDDATGNPIPVNFYARPLATAGASLRVNLFGALIIEPFYAVPILGNTRGAFGINLLPGW